MPTEEPTHPAENPRTQQGQPVLILVHCGQHFLPSPVVIPLSQLPLESGKRETTGQEHLYSGTKSVFGRNQLSQVGLQDNQISGSHFGIWRRGDEHGSHYYLEDLKSKNGTHVDGEKLPPAIEKRAIPSDKARVMRAQLRDGAILRAGNTVLVFREQFIGNLTPDSSTFQHQEESMVGPFGLRELRDRVDALARHGAASSAGKLNVLLEAGTGTGKEMLARYVAERLGRGKPFVAVNVPSVVPTLFAAEFFGNGVWQHGVQASPGMVGQAKGGCLFLDEIHEVNRDVHVQLLRFLQDRDFRRVGESQAQIADVLVVAATSLSMKERAERDIYERLRQANLRLPPLCERSEDIPEIAKELLRRQEQLSAEVPLVEVEVLEFLLLQPWAGNIRELRNTLMSLLRLTDATPTPGLRWWAIEELVKQGLLSLPPLEMPRSLTVGRILRAMKQGNESKAAEALGIDRNQLRRWLGLQ